MATHISLRLSDEMKAQIDKRAASSKLNRSEYMIRASLGEITNPTDADSRLEQHEERIQRLERWMELSN